MLHKNKKLFLESKIQKYLDVKILKIRNMKYKDQVKRFEGQMTGTYCYTHCLE